MREFCRMHLLLCAATEREIWPLVDILKKKKNNSISVLITGVGIMATTYSLTRSILFKKPDFMLQAGIAGSLDGAEMLGRTVIIEREVTGDAGVFEKGNFSSLFDMGLQKDGFPWTEHELQNDSVMLTFSDLPRVKGVTVNEISTDKHRIQYYKEKLGAKAESMEGAAFHFVALMENIPFLQLRSLSNIAGVRDKSQWQIERSITDLNKETEKIILQLTDL